MTKKFWLRVLLNSSDLFKTVTDGDVLGFSI